MKIEEIGKCPCCFDHKTRSAMVNFYTVRKDNGELEEIHIFGDDDFDVPSANQTVTDAKFSNDGKSVTEVVCPRCKERIAVEIPIIKQQESMFLPLKEGAKPLTVVSEPQAQKQAD